MAKDTYYFSHDYGARNDPKLVKLQMEMGHEGKGIFWDLIEMLYEQNGKLPYDEYESISFAIRTNYDKLKRVINDFSLFENDGKFFWSKSVNVRLKARTDKSTKARESIRKRWENTNVLRTKNEGNTIKERKGKESKRKKTIKEKSEGKIPFQIFWDAYDKKVDVSKSEAKWNALPKEDQEKILENIPKYKLSRPDKNFRLNPCTYLNNKSWLDEIILPSKPSGSMSIVTDGSILPKPPTPEQVLKHKLS